MGKQGDGWTNTVDQPHLKISYIVDKEGLATVQGSAITEAIPNHILCQLVEVDLIKVIMEEIKLMNILKQISKKRMIVHG
mmetsp:Transcript_13013/g.9419  ORF Transcript_13013/g.9419 Transcript_13013/m.9419 type:complete len:80 (+) Transcript_13013:336-575(+)